MGLQNEQTGFGETDSYNKHLHEQFLPSVDSISWGKEEKWFF